jgi:Gluconate 2-dehydrogenase subunit 3
MNTPIPQTMGRREAVRRLAILMGGAMIGSEVLLRGESVADKGPQAGFTDADRALLDEIGETIIPATNIPGAKATNIGAFMTMMVTDCYSAKQHAAFSDGLVAINDASKARFGTSFVESTPAQRTELCNALDAQQRQEAKEAKKETAAGNPSKAPSAHYFRMMKDLTILGYFSSEIGCTQAVTYLEVPGAYHGDVPFKKGDREWY